MDDEKDVVVVELEVQVDDPRALWREAARQWLETMGSPDAAELRTGLYPEALVQMLGDEEDPNLTACVQMVADPGESWAGTTILESSAEMR